MATYLTCRMAENPGLYILITHRWISSMGYFTLPSKAQDITYLFLFQVWTDFDNARWCGVRDRAHEKLSKLLSDPEPEVRC